MCRARVSCVLLLVIALASARAHAGDELPSFDDALKALVHGAAHMQRKKISLSYDFRHADQLQDFSGTVASYSNGRPYAPAPGTENKPIDNGEMCFRSIAPVTLKIPFEELELAELQVKSVKDLEIFLNGRSDGVRVELGPNAGVHPIGGETTSKHHRRTRNVTLSPAKTYRIEIAIRRDRLTVALNGNPLFRERLAAGATPVRRIGFTTSTKEGNPLLEQCAFRGKVSPTIVQVVANHDRLVGKKPPVWKQTFSYSGPHYDVSSPVSEANAKHWSEVAESAISAWFNDLPVPKGLVHKGKIYVFQYSEVMESYALSPEPRILEGSTIAVLDNGNAKESERRARTLVLQEFALSFYLTAPTWWEEGIANYYATEPHEKESSAQPRLLAEAKDQLTDLTWRKLQSFLNDELATKRATSLAWAWFDFLARGQSGAHKELLVELHKSFMSGKNLKEINKKFFPNEQLQKLCDDFKAYVRSL